MNRHHLFLIASFLIAGCAHQRAQLQDQQNIDRLISERGSEVQVCWDEALQKNPHLPSGQVTVRAQQHIDGALHSTQLISGFAGSNEIMECVSSKINAWKTPPPKTWGPVELSFQFTNTINLKALGEKDFGTVLRAHRPKIGDCFETTLKENPQNPGGEIEFEFVRTKEGRVKDLKMLSGFSGSDSIFQCMSSIIQDFELAQVPEEMPMKWTYRFKKSETVVQGSAPLSH